LANPPGENFGYNR